MTAPTRKPLTADSLQFFFFPTSDGYGVLLERAYHELLVRFEHARNTAGTWGELLEMLGPNATEFVLTFTQCDERLPEAGDSIDSLLGDVWVLYTQEFPFVQCAEESFSFYGECFPEEGALVATTEYDEEFRFFHESNFRRLKHLEEQGHTLEAANPDRIRLRPKVATSTPRTPEKNQRTRIDALTEPGLSASARGDSD